MRARAIQSDSGKGRFAYRRSSGSARWRYFGREYAVVYDSIMRDVPYESWVDYLVDVASLHGRRLCSILDLACGTGSVALCAARRGFSVLGIDASNAMLDVFRDKLRDEPGLASCRLARACFPKLPRITERFDAAVWFFDGVNYLTSLDALRSTFEKVNRLLRAGGILVFDVNSEAAYRAGAFEPAPTTRLPNGRILRVSSNAHYDPLSELFDLEVELRDARTNRLVCRERQAQRFYPPETIIDALRAAAFDARGWYRAFTLVPATLDDDRWTFVAVKGASVVERGA